MTVMWFDEMPIDKAKLLAGVRHHAAPGHRASREWLANVAENHLLAFMFAYDASTTPGHPAQADCVEVCCEVVVQLLQAERGKPAPVPSVDEAIRYVSYVKASCEIEWYRRHGYVTVEPPLASVFDAGDSVVKPTGKVRTRVA